MSKSDSTGRLTNELSLRPNTHWAVIPLGIVGALMFLLFGPRQVLISNFHGDYTETHWPAPVPALIGVAFGIFAVVRVLDVTFLPVARTIFDAPNSIDDGLKTKSQLKTEDKIKVIDARLVTLVSVVSTSDPTKSIGAVAGSTTVKTETEIYHFPAAMSVNVDTAYVGQAEGKTWVCFNKDLLYTANCDLPIKVERVK